MRYFVPGVVLLAFGCGAVPGVGQSAEVQAICGHKWWAKKPTPAQVTKWAERIAQQQRNAVAYIDDRGQVEVLSLTVETKPQYEAAGPFRMKPDKLGERFIYLDLQSYTTRPDAGRIISAIKAALDRAEFSEEKPH